MVTIYLFISRLIVTMMDDMKIIHRKNWTTDLAPIAHPKRRKRAHRQQYLLRKRLHGHQLPRNPQSLLQEYVVE